MALVLVVLVGCVERTLTISTDPQGALVYLNDVEVGRSPVTQNFTWYGDYDVIVRKKGYRTLKTHARVQEPWYQIPPIDFFAECLVPATIRDKHHLDFTLEPITLPEREALIDRAEQFRERTLYEDK